MASPDPRIKVDQIPERKMYIGQTPNHAKFCGDLTRSVWDIRDRKFVLLEKVFQNSPKLLKTCYPLKPPIMPNFINIGETTLEKRFTNFFTPFNILAPQGTPWTKGHWSRWWGTPTPLQPPANFCPVPKTPLRDICCQASLILLLAW